MAAFASDRRAGWVRFFVVLLCALFLFATLGAPAARAEALTLGLFTAAAVLSAATAALGFKLSNSAEGQATLAKMVQDFKVSATAVGLVLVGSKINGLIDGVDYIKMQVKAGLTYLDERVVAWVQQWLGKNGVYDGSSSIEIPEYAIGGRYDVQLVSGITLSQFLSLYGCDTSNLPASAKDYYIDPYTIVNFRFDSNGSLGTIYIWKFSNTLNLKHLEYGKVTQLSSYVNGFEVQASSLNVVLEYWYINGNTMDHSYQNQIGNSAKIVAPRQDGYPWDYTVSNAGSLVNSGNDTGLSGTDTLGKDVVDKTLDETLVGLKEWAPDWWDAGADSSTNSAVGAKDLPLNMGSDVKTVTGNPALEVDQPLIYTPWFSETLDNLRNGETSGTVTNTATSAADTADKAEAAQGTVDDAQGVVQSLLSWGLDYISPDKGLFSRFPLCIPYDAYLLVTAALGVDAQDLGDIVGQSPGQLSAQVDDGVAVHSDFVPVLSVKHDWTQDGVTTPVEVTIDLRPYDAIIKMIRTLVSVYVIAELIASEYKRIRGA